MLASLVGSSGAKIFKPPKGKTWDLTPIWPSDLASIDTSPPLLHASAYSPQAVTVQSQRKGSGDFRRVLMDTFPSSASPYFTERSGARDNPTPPPSPTLNTPSCHSPEQTAAG